MRILKWPLMEEAPDGGGGGEGSGEGGGEGDGGGPSPEILAKAKEMGWAPKEQWRGNPENWQDAPEFVKRGETFVPFLQHERKKLRGELSARDQQLEALRQENAGIKSQLQAITEFNEQMAADRVARRKTEIGAELKVAREAGDDVRVAELQNELGEVVKPKPATKQAPTQEQQRQEQQQQPAILPWVKGFLDSNSDFFDNPRKVALFNVEMLERRKAGDGRVGDVDGVALLTEAKEAVDKMFGGNTRRQAPSKTEDSRPGGNNGGGGGGSGGRTYAEMPADARAQCDKQEARFVGPDKAFKKQADWRKHFVSEYFGPSATAMSRTME